MAKKQGRRYEETYKREAVRFLEETGKPVRTVAEELQVSESALARWRRQYGTGEAAGEALTPSDAAELRRLQRENAILRQERDFLKKATAYFASPPE